MALVELKLIPSFYPPRRTRAGVTLERRKSIKVDVSEDQLKELEADKYIIVSPVAKKKPAKKEKKETTTSKKTD